MNVKDYFGNYKGCMLVYILFILIFVFATFTAENFAECTNEVIFIVITTLLGLGVIYYSSRHELELHKVALVMIIVFGLLMVFFTPPFSFLDEPAHFTRAELLSEGSLYPEATEKGIYINDYYFIFQQSFNGVTILSENNNYNNPITDHKDYWEWAPDSPFYTYILSALGILIAKALNLSAIWALYLSRIANLILYGAVAYFMIKIIPKYKLALMVISTMPMCIVQASFSTYDAFILTFTLIIITYFIKMYSGEVNARNLAIFFVSVLLISLIKEPYVILAFLPLAIRFEDEKLKKYSIIAMLAVFITIALTTSYYLTSPFTTTTVETYNTTTVSNISFVGQIRFIQSNPLVIVTLIKDMLFSIPHLFVLKSNFFHYTGYKGIKLINALYVLFFIGFSIFYKTDINLEKKERMILAAIFLIVYVGIYAIFYLTWTPLGTTTILGVQSRYFLPVIALLPMIVNFGKIENKEL
ncbi:MAG: hypothetical protein BZ137_09865, partial [Methanosphaera sp. rholeuAM130]